MSKYLARRALFARDGWRCQYCGSTGKLTLDHVVPEERGGPFVETSAIHWVLGGTVILLLAIAATRETAAGGDVRSPHPWLAAAWILSASGQFVLLAHPASYRPILVPAEVAVQVVAAAAGVAKVPFPPLAQVCDHR